MIWCTFQENIDSQPYLSMADETDSQEAGLHD
jgi:hypothetical protein